MSPRRPMRVLAVLLAFGAGLAVFAATRAGAPAAPPATAPALRPAPLGALRDAVRAGRPGSETALASAYLQKARETGDLAYQARAETLLRRALARDPRDAGAVVELGTLAASRHDFRRALALARRARALAPGSPAHFPLLVDALVELGRFRAAERALQRFADLRPGLPAYARVSYLRELRGDLRRRRAGDGTGRRRRRRRARERGRRPGAARRPRGGAGPARARRARLRRGARRRAGLPAGAGRPRAARGRPRRPARRDPRRCAASSRGCRCPSTRSRSASCSSPPAAPPPRGARSRWSAPSAGCSRARASTPTPSSRSSRPTTAPRARRSSWPAAAWAAAPGIRAADALGWALTKAGRPRAGLAWARRALRLGSLDPLLRFHAGMAARGAERRRHLRLALAHGLAGQPWQAAAARRALEAGR